MHVRTILAGLPNTVPHKRDGRDPRDLVLLRDGARLTDVVALIAAGHARWAPYTTRQNATRRAESIRESAELLFP
ncbi:hypothetical protein Lfu02_49940 [Longispora fulva]|uniref:Uncharacterized protein n=1 Tax=Longispora fulva TaxID=619741 RepID=A0A8J7GIX9_9ACTN|nr:hypothetical protein [Longispora fulva]GIG60622.1 hypothetical protein Lfu02_49940 [Longispora fulva]